MHASKPIPTESEPSRACCAALIGTLSDSLRTSDGVRTPDAAPRHTCNLTPK